MGVDSFIHSVNFSKELNDAFEAAAKDLDANVAAEVNADGTANGKGKEEVPIIAKIDTFDGKPNIGDSM